MVRKNVQKVNNDDGNLTNGRYCSKFRNVDKMAADNYKNTNDYKPYECLLCKCALYQHIFISVSLANKISIQFITR